MSDQKEQPQLVLILFWHHLREAETQEATGNLSWSVVLQEVIRQRNSFAQRTELVVYPYQSYDKKTLLLVSAQEIPQPGHADISACLPSATDLVTAATLKENSLKHYSAPIPYLSLWSCSSFSSSSLFWVSFLRQQSSWLTVSSSDSKFLDSSAYLPLLQNKPEVSNNSCDFMTALPHPWWFWDLIWEPTVSHSAEKQRSDQRAHSQEPRPAHKPVATVPERSNTVLATCSAQTVLHQAGGTIWYLSRENKNSRDNTKRGAFILTYLASPSGKCCRMFPK